jgi:hypothetical protein
LGRKPLGGSGAFHSLRAQGKVILDNDLKENPRLPMRWQESFFVVSQVVDSCE